MTFLRGTTPIWSTQDLPRRFKEWKACLVEIGQTAHKLETNSLFQFSHGSELGILMYGNWGVETCPRRYFCGSLSLSGTILRPIQAPR